jgi:hypothetical protein
VEPRHRYHRHDRRRCPRDAQAWLQGDWTPRRDRVTYPRRNPPDRRVRNGRMHINTDPDGRVAVAAGRRYLGIEGNPHVSRPNMGVLVTGDSPGHMKPTSPNTSIESRWPWCAPVVWPQYRNTLLDGGAPSPVGPGRSSALGGTLYANANVYTNSGRMTSSRTVFFNSEELPL